MFCANCGEQISDNAYICPHCGCKVQNERASNNKNTLLTVAKIFMIISTVLSGIYLIPLAWCIPMTISLSRKINNGEKISTGFKICVLLFVNLVAGILLLCASDD